MHLTCDDALTTEVILTAEVTQQQYIWPVMML